MYSLVTATTLLLGGVRGQTANKMTELVSRCCVLTSVVFAVQTSFERQRATENFTHCSATEISIAQVKINTDGTTDNKLDLASGLYRSYLQIGRAHV